MATLEERLAKAQKGSLEQRLEKAQTENAGSAFGETVGRSFLDAVFGAPKLLALGAAGVQAPFSERGFSEIFEEEKGKFPANLAFNTNELGAFARSLPELIPQRPVDQPGEENPVPLFAERFSGKFDEELEQINTEEARVREKFPFATGAGDIGGMALSIMAGRLPFLSKIENAEAWLAGKKFADAIKNPGAAGELGNVVKNLINAPGIRSLMRGTGRATEAGLEAATIEALTGDDPLRTAAYVVGGQAVGSSMLTVSKGLVSGGPMKVGAKLALTAGAFFGLLQTLKEGTPGSDNPIATIEESFEHVLLLLAAGGIATVAGAGRIRRTDAVTWPRSAEFISTLPRATMISLVSGWVSASPDEQQTIETTLSQLQQDPEFFGPELTERLLKALESGKFIEALREEL